MARRKKLVLRKGLTKAVLGKKTKGRISRKAKKIKKIPLGDVLEARKNATAERIARTKAFLERRKGE